MNKHTRLIVTLLFAVMLILAAAISRSFLAGKDDSLGNRNTSENNRVLSENKGYCIITDDSGSYGIADSSGRTIVSPEWSSLEFAGDNCCIASMMIGGKLLSGCIDYEGNITLPFIYKDIRLAGNNPYYIARSENGSFTLLSQQMRPVIRREWDSCSFSGSDITLANDTGSFTYTCGENGRLLSRASVSGETMMRRFTLDVTSRVLLSKLSAQMLEDIVLDTGNYLEYAYSGDDEILSQLTTGRRSSFVQLFPDDHKILSKRLMGISDIYIYSLRSDDSIPHFAASVVADTEITYTDDSAKVKSLRDEYKAVIEFSGSSDMNFTAVSASFEKTAPDYPAAVPDDSSGEIRSEKSEEVPALDDSQKIQPTSAANAGR